MKFPKKASIIFIFSGFFLIAISFYDTQLISVNADEFYPAPDYQAITLDNEVVSLTDYKGKVILVNLWATWCEPCRDEMPLLEDLSQTFPPTDWNKFAETIKKATGQEGYFSYVLFYRPNVDVVY